MSGTEEQYSSEGVLGRMLEEKARNMGDREFYQFKREQPLTYAELNTTANMVANGLARVGIATGDKVGVMLPNCPEFVHTWFGLAKLGAVMVAINTGLRGNLLGYVLNDSEVTTLVVDLDLLERVK